ncbi:glycosyltransferase family 2 protein [Pannus brasiliensis CCIBt3594]|uniref:Glycosyltransferase family 2 protein n=1 Tax=Pannus brasiliensis CCIBt3594 TaxID=1427578 RepID=A0AAW9R025_9CHRO
MLLKDPIVSILVTIRDEEKTIGFFIETMAELVPSLVHNYEIILIDDGSRDRTVEIATDYAERDMNLRLIVLSRHYGHEIAVTAGLEQAIGDYVLLIDTAVVNFPDIIPRLLEKIVGDRLDVVYAADISRTLQSPLRRVFGRFSYGLISHLTKFEMPVDASPYRVLNRQTVNALTALKEHNRYLKILYAYVGYRIGSIPFRFPERSSRVRSGWLATIGRALDASFSFSTLPLRYMSLMAISISGMLMLLAGYVLVEKFWSDTPIADGWTSLIFIISLLFSVLFFFLALLSEYIGRILIETKKRPLYYIRQEIGGTQFQIRSIVDRV